MSQDYLLPLDKGYVSPNNEHLLLFRNRFELTTKEMAGLVGEADKKYRKLLNQKNYLNGFIIDYCEWRMLLEMFGVVEPVKLKQRIPTIKPEVFLDTGFKNPSFAEFSYLCKRTGYSADTISKEIGVPVEVVQSAINHPSEKIIRLHQDKWLDFLVRNDMADLESLKKVPDLHFKTLLFGSEFEPPRPNQLRRFIAWTGRTPAEIEELFDIKESQLTYLMSNRSSRSSAVKLPNAIFSRYNWVPPYTNELREILKATKIDPGAVAKQLRMDKNEVYRILKMPNSYRLSVNQDDWFAFLDKHKILSANDINKMLPRESRTHNISYARWIYLLSAFGIVDLSKAK